MDQEAPALLAYVTCRDEAEAERIGRTLVKERLAACVNLIPGMRSLYRWQGVIEEGREVVLLAKTIGARGDELIARVKALHSYTCPCVVLVPLLGGNPDYLAWLTEGTSRT